MKKLLSLVLCLVMVLAAIPAMADAAIADACTVTNPRPVTRADVMQIYRELW